MLNLIHFPDMHRAKNLRAELLQDTCWSRDATMMMTWVSFGCMRVYVCFYDVYVYIYIYIYEELMQDTYWSKDAAMMIT